MFKIPSLSTRSIRMVFFLSASVIPRPICSLTSTTLMLPGKTKKASYWDMAKCSIPLMPPAQPKSQFLTGKWIRKKYPTRSCMIFTAIHMNLLNSNSTPTSHFHLYHIVFYRFFYLIFTDYFSFKYNKFYNVLKMDSN